MAWHERIRNLFRGDKIGERIDDEFAFHLAERIDELMDQGMSEVEARSQARRQFGNLGRQKEQTRDVDLMRWLDTLAQDIRYAIRKMARQPGYTATALVLLMFGIGANTAIFSIVNAVMLRTLPIEDPHALVQLKLGEGDDELSTPIWEQIRDRQTAFSGVMAYASERFDLADGGEREMAPGLWVSGEFFHVLGVPPLLGRTFNAADERWGGGPDGAVAVISHRFWQSRFQGDPQVVGRTLRMNRHVFTVVGVTPPWFTGLDTDRPFDIAIPLGCQPLFHPERKQAEERYHWWLRILGRLSPGEPLKQADDRMRAVERGILRATMPEQLGAEDQPRYLNQHFLLRPVAIGFSQVRTQYRTALFALMATAALVLLIACANIANLLLASAAARSREFSVRIAIGASRWRLVRQLMTESLLLSLLGAAGGLLIAQWGGKALVHFISTAGRPIEIDTSPDVRVLAFTAGMAMITALLFGLAPAMRASGTGAQSLRRGDGNVLAGPARLGFGKALVAAQVAFSLVLLMGTGLFLGTLRNLLSVDIGFDRQQVLLATVDSEQMAASGQRRAQLYRELRSRVQTMPGVVSVSESFLAPLGAAGWAQPVYPEGFAVKSPMDSLVFLNRVSPGYFHTMKTAVMMGREFNERDTLKAPRVMIINETTARRFFGSANPVGKTIGMDKGVPGGGRELYQVIGIVRDARYNRIDEGPRSVAYVASTQVDDPSPTVTLEIRTDRAPEAMIAPVRQAMIAVDRNVSLQFRSLETQVNESVMGPRLVALLSAIFGVLALLLAIVGLYGVTSYRVKQRSNEIGVRIALGAGQGSVVWLLLREVLLVLMLGVSGGIAIALGMVRLVTALLYGMKRYEPEQVAATVLLLVMASLIAAYFPVRRATRLDPMTTLRAE